MLCLGLSIPVFWVIKRFCNIQKLRIKKKSDLEQMSKQLTDDRSKINTHIKNVRSFISFYFQKHRSMLTNIVYS